jgi:hypothetical protein
MFRTSKKSVAIATWKEMPVIPVNKVAHKNKIIGKRGSEEEEGMGR